MTPHTRKLYFAQEQTEDTSPSVESSILDERIAARRIRIENRVAQQQPGYFDKNIDEVEESKLQMTKLSREQVATSLQRIVNLCRNGNAFITNIKVSCDARENLRRLEEEELSMVRNQKLEFNANEAERLFDEVQSKWDLSNSMKIPQALHDLLEQQKKMCSDMIDEKNRLIHELHLELKAKDDHFVKELKKRTEDVDIMVERMESQMKSMQRTYTFELQEIERAFLQERDNLLDIQNTDWNDFIEEIRKKQVDYLIQRKERIEELEGLIATLRTSHSEEFNALKLKLVTEIQQLETDLQQLKPAYQLNLEKLEYNFQVLKRRDEENTITQSQQKRTITRLQDNLNHLRIRARNQEEQLKSENETLSEDYKKRMEMFRELQKKSKFLIEAEDRNFRELWIMNKEEIKKEAVRLLNADRVISEQQLGVKWTEPELSFMDNYDIVSNDIAPEPAKLKRKASLTNTIFQLTSRSVIPEDHSTSLLMDTKRKYPVPTSLRQAPKQVVKKFLHMLCYEPEFLIEEKMKRLLAPMTEEQQLLIRLDAVLNVLEIHNEEQLDKLFTYFLLPYEYPLTKQDLTVVRLSETTSVPIGVHAGRTKTPSRGNSPSRPSHLEKSDRSSLIEHKSSVTQQLQNSEKVDYRPSFATCQVEANEVEPELRLIDSVDVVSVLNQFAVDFCAGKGPLNLMKPIRLSINTEGRVVSPSESQFETSFNVQSSSGQIPKSGDSVQFRDEACYRDYWQRYINVLVPEDKQKLWSAVLKSLNEYRNILKSRANLIVETEMLKAQNAELKHLLEEYVSSKVNHEMAIPPIETMKIYRD